MAELISTDAPEGSDEKRVKKYPSLAVDILCSEVWKIVEDVYSSPAVIRSIFSFITQEEIPSPTISGCCSKVATSLMKAKIPEVINNNNKVNNDNNVNYII